MFLEISKNSRENTCAKASFLIKLQAEDCNFIRKETLAQVFSCEFYKISKNTFFTEHLWATLSVKLVDGMLIRYVFRKIICLLQIQILCFRPFPAGIYLLKFNNRNTRTRCEICSKLTIKAPERYQYRCSGVFMLTLNIFHTWF